MIFAISDVTHQTAWILFFLVAIGIVSLKKASSPSLSPETTGALKGFAILAVIFSHIEYFLVTDHEFLFPLGILAGVGVNLFLLLSGFGLARSTSEYPVNLITFYKKRLAKLFLPLWMILLVSWVLDYFWLHRSYALLEMALNAFGIFPTSDLYAGLNAPFWYFTFLLGYYAIFPWVYRKNHVWRSFFLLIAASLAMTALPLPVDENVRNLYRLHTLAFPLGVFIASFSPSSKLVARVMRPPVRITIFAICAYLFYYTALHSHVGEGIWPEQLTSLVTTLSILSLAILSPFRSSFLVFVGTYSYELYLLHWPFLYRYSPLFSILPGAWATLLSFAFLFILAWALQRTTFYIHAFITKKPAA
ncbi:acyltransferase [Patescibacteria group bacterium]|nr:acyltransferase [Patescibacteria group bacterium]